MEQVEIFYWSEKDYQGDDVQDMKFASENAAAIDLRCANDFDIKKGEYSVIGTGLYVSIPDGYCMKVFPRSGISAKTDLIFKNTVGIIDSDYRGREIFVMYYNLGNETVSFKRGDRVAQATIEKVLPIKYTAVADVNTLKEFGNDRGGGLGSTGLK